MMVLTPSAVYAIRSQEGSPQRVVSGRGFVRATARNGLLVVAQEDGTLRYWRDTKQLAAVASGISEPIAALYLLQAEPPQLLVGTDDSAYLYRLDGLDGPAQRVEAFDRLEVRPQWKTPWGGPPAVRVLAGTPDGWVYADIHVGSIMRSPDRGRSWEPVTPDLNEDVHEVATCPAAPNRVYANTANAVYLSEDRGNSWHHRAAGLPRRYGRAIAVHPHDPDLILATVSDGPHSGNGTLHRSEDAGQHWEPIADGFPAPVDGNIDTGRVAFDGDGTAWVAWKRDLYRGTDRAKRWKLHWTAPEPIRQLIPEA